MAHQEAGQHPPTGLMLKDVMPKLDKWWFQYPHLLKLNFVLLSAILTEATLGFDGSMLNGLQSLKQWSTYFDHPSGARLGAMVNGTKFGSLIATLVSAWLCDRFGRRWPIFWGSCIIIAGSILQGASQNIAMFIASRWFLGFGLGILQCCSTLLLSEVAYPAHRGKITAIYEPTWPLGALVAAWLTFGTFKMQNTWAWRLPSLLQCMTSIVQAILILFTPESPRWLISKNRHDEAFEMLTKYHGGGDRESALVKFEIAEINASLEVAQSQRSSSWLDFFKTKGNRHRLFIVSTAGFLTQWAGNSLVSYFLPLILKNVGITDSYTQLVINGCAQVWSFLWALFFALLIDRFGRRKLLLASYGSMFVTYLIWTILAAINTQQNFANKAMGHGIVVLIFAFFCFYHITAPIMPLYTTEVMAYDLRAKGQAIFQFGQSIVSIFNGFVNPIAIENIGWRYYIVFVCLLALWTAIVYFAYPETKGLSLEEISNVFDGKNSTLDQGIAVSPKFEEQQDVVNVELARK